MTVRKYKYRCGRDKCRAIYHLSKSPEEYRTIKKCDCGGTLHDYSIDRKRNRSRKCNCDGYPWDGPHKKGSAPWCVHSKTEPTAEDYEDRYGDRYGE